MRWIWSGKRVFQGTYALFKKQAVLDRRFGIYREVRGRSTREVRGWTRQHHRV